MMHANNNNSSIGQILISLMFELLFFVYSLISTKTNSPALVLSLSISKYYYYIISQFVDNWLKLQKRTKKLDASAFDSTQYQLFARNLFQPYVQWNDSIFNLIFLFDCLRLSLLRS